MRVGRSTYPEQGLTFGTRSLPLDHESGPAVGLSRELQVVGVPVADAHHAAHFIRSVYVASVNCHDVEEHKIASLAGTASVSSRRYSVCDSWGVHTSRSPFALMKDVV